MSTATTLGPGLHLDMPMADYLAMPHMSASRLEIFRRSPLQYLHSLTQPPKQSPALERGTALHLAVLEPEKFDGHYVVLGQCEGTKRDGGRCGYQGSVWRAGQSFCGTHDPAKGQPVDPVVEILGADIYEQVTGMRDAILAHDRARSLFVGDGAFEASIVFEDPETGVTCRVRPDRLIERAGMLVDIKATRDATAHAFARQAENLGYFRKLALYRRALRSVGWPLKEIAVLAIEPTAPHDLVPYLLDERAINTADEEVTQLLHHFAMCRETGDWPGYARDFAILYRLSWATQEAA